MCDKCDGKYVRKRDLQSQNFGPLWQKVWMCPLYIDFYTHGQSGGAWEKLSFLKCLQCLKFVVLFSAQLNSYNYIKEHSCDSCKKSFSEKGSLKRHIAGRQEEYLWNMQFCVLLSFPKMQILWEHFFNQQKFDLLSET